MKNGGKSIKKFNEILTHEIEAGIRRGHPFCGGWIDHNVIHDSYSKSRSFDNYIRFVDQMERMISRQRYHDRNLEQSYPRRRYGY